MRCDAERRRPVAPGAERRLALAAALVLLALPWWTACAGGPGTRSVASATNSQLGPAYAQWLVGAAGRIATEDERRRFMTLSDDFAAADFVESFWARRDPDPETPGNPVRETFEQRTAEADRQFTEAGVSGHKTARGTIYVLYGAPGRTDYEVPRRGGSAIEVWFYPDDAPVGLDGRRPDGSYRFQKVGDVTGLYRPGGPPPRPGVRPH